MGKETKKTLEELEAERLALEQEAYDDKNRMLKQSQFQELLELQTDEEPEFVEEIVAMFVDDAEAMLVELEELFAEGSDEPIDYAKARGVLHKLKGSSSTFGADGVQQKCEELREHCIGEDPAKCRTGEGQPRGAARASGRARGVPRQVHREDQGDPRGESRGIVMRGAGPSPSGDEESPVEKRSISRII
jgi:histidine-containing phosphotransfer protein